MTDYDQKYYEDDSYTIVRMDRETYEKMEHFRDVCTGSEKNVPADMMSLYNAYKTLKLKAEGKTTSEARASDGFELVGWYASEIEDNENYGLHAGNGWNDYYRIEKATIVIETPFGRDIDASTVVRTIETLYETNRVPEVLKKYELSRCDYYLQLIPGQKHWQMKYPDQRIKSGKRAYRMNEEQSEEQVQEVSNKLANQLKPAVEEKKPVKRTVIVDESHGFGMHM